MKLKSRTDWIITDAAKLIMNAKKLIKQEKQKRFNDRMQIGCYLVIVITSFLLYYNTIQNNYALDDKAIITENRFTEKGFTGIGNHLTTSYWEGIDKKLQSYRPLAPVLFALEVGFWGFNPHASHFVNILLYAITGLILFQVLRKLFQHYSDDTGYLLPLVGTMLFLAHPLHTEVVANLKSRDTMLEFLFLLLSVNFLFSYITSRKMKELFWSVFFFFPALLSKESSISYLLMVPVILILYDHNTIRKKITITLPYLIPVVLFVILFFQVTGGDESARLMLLDNMLIADEPSSGILATKFLILGKYLGLLFYPHPLVFDYSYNHIPMTDFSNPVAIFSILIYLFMVTVLVILLGKNLFSQKTRPLFTLIAFC
ncbi:MAG: glycosyltransferase family 39 protein, partial [Bacteroidia bacterium]|nr:glycosyltransferase family 39 protein [Bacteroidia bacterium]